MTQVNNRFSVTIKNLKLLSEMDYLINSKQFESKTEIVNRCVEIALPLLVEGKLDFRHPEQKTHGNVEEILKRHNSTLKDLSVITNLSFNLITSLFKERSLTLQGLKTNSEDMESGTYEILPEHYQEILNELMK